MNNQDSTTPRTTRITSQASMKSGNDSKERGLCRICHNTGYVVEKQLFPEYDAVIPLDVGTRCPVCQGKVKFEATGFPNIFSEADMTKFDFSEYGSQGKLLREVTVNFFQNFPEWERREKGLYLWSATKGSGKTFLSCCLSASVQAKYKKKLMFVSAVDYLQAVKETFKQGTDVPNNLYGYLNCDLLILDDLGAEKPSDWANQELFHLIDYRMCKGKQMLITSNVPPESLKCDGRVIDRISRMCLALQMPEVSVRKRRAKAENDRFLQEILSGKQGA